MNFRWPFLSALLALNGLAYVALRQSITLFVKQEKIRRTANYALIAVLVLLNVPLCLFFAEQLDDTLLKLSTSALAVVFYPSTAWLATIIGFGLLCVPLAIVFAIAAWLDRRSPRAARTSEAESANGSEWALSRRAFVTAGSGLLIPPIYAVACYGAYGNLDELEISPERRFAIPNLPRALDGMTIVQLSDLHVGPYIREKELRVLVDRVNELRPDLIAITGDILDVSLKSLPDAVRGLSGLQASVGTVAVLGNHDLYADQYSRTKQHRGGVRIVEGMQTIGVRTLRNEVMYLGEGPDRLALMGLDWLNPNPNTVNFFRYQEAETIQQLQHMTAELEPETPRILLAHHPDTFQNVGPFQIPLTISGHTHGGGQIILGHIGNVPLGVGMLRFRYLSGLYQEGGGSLYVNRGIGYLGIPIRINCPPEISRFRLVRSVANGNPNS